MSRFEPSKTIIHFVRHGEVSNPENILYARIPRFRLSKSGVLQSKRVAELLAKRSLVMVYHSPMLRARQTARYVAALSKVNLKNSALLTEIHTPYEGKPLQYLDSIDWNLYENISPEYERPQDIVTRIIHFCQRARREHLGREIAAVTHGDVVLFAQLWARDLPLTHENRRSVQPYPEHCSVTTLTFTEGAALPIFTYTSV